MQALRAWCASAPQASPCLDIDGQIAAVSLRFTTPQLEKAFADGRREQLAVALRWMFLVALVVYLLIIVAIDSVRDITSCEAANDVHPDKCHLLWLQLAYQVAFGGQLVTCSLVAHSLARCSRTPTWVIEVVIVASITIFLCAAPMYYKHYLSRAYGYEDTVAIWATVEPTDGSLLLYMDVCVTSMHLLVPVRWRWLLPMQIVCVLAFLLPAVILGSATPSMVPSNTVAISALVVMASLGKRALEINERRFFLTMLKEKRMRFEAEFQLSQKAAEGARREFHGSSQSCPSNHSDEEDVLSEIASEGLSVPQTTLTGKVFHAGSSSFSFQRLANLGEKELWRIRTEEVSLLPGEALGEGGFGIVARGIYSGVEVAIKATKQDIHAHAGKTLMAMCNELRILRRLRHPNIVFFYGAVLNATADSVSVHLVLELISGMSLEEFVKGCGDGNQLVRAHLLADVSSALRYLHSQRPAIVHGDLKDTNVFVEQRADSANRAKLLDFGLSRVLTRHARPLGGSLRWMAPEVVGGARFPCTAADVFSLGRIMFFVSTREKPFADKFGAELKKAVKRARELPWAAGHEQRLARHCRPLAEECLNRKASLRPIMVDVARELQIIAEGLKGSGTGTSDRPARGSLTPEQMEMFNAFGFVQHTISDASTSAAGNEQPGLAPKQEHAAPGAASAASASTQGPAPSCVKGGRPADDPKETRLVHTAYTPTPHMTMLASTTSLVMQWNHDVPAACCCALHAGLEKLGAVRRELAKQSCISLEAPTGQCWQCGLLFTEDDAIMCHFCGEEFCAEADDTRSLSKQSEGCSI